MWRTDQFSIPAYAKCIIELDDGSYTLARYYFGVWEDLLSAVEYGSDVVKRWRYLNDDDRDSIRELLGIIAVKNEAKSPVEGEKPTKIFQTVAAYQIGSASAVSVLQWSTSASRFDWTGTSGCSLTTGNSFRIR